MTNHRARFLYLRWPYHANVINTLDTTSKSIGSVFIILKVAHLKAFDKQFYAL